MRDGGTQDGLSSPAASKASQQNVPRKKKRGGIVEALAECESVCVSFYEPVIWLRASSQPIKGNKTTFNPGLQTQDWGRHRTHSHAGKVLQELLAAPQSIYISLFMPVDSVFFWYIWGGGVWV